jgi:hypothetical protein
MRRMAFAVPPLAAAVAALAANASGSHTTDLAQPRSQDELFALTAGVGTVSAYQIAAGGDLVPTATAAGVPASATGLVAK